VRGPTGPFATVPNQDGSETRCAQTVFAKESDSGRWLSRTQRGFKYTFVQLKSTKLSTKELTPIPTIDSKILSFNKRKTEYCLTLNKIFGHVLSFPSFAPIKFLAII